MELTVINSRYNMFWYELVHICNGIITQSFGQYRTIEEAERFKADYDIQIGGK